MFKISKFTCSVVLMVDISKTVCLMILGCLNFQKVHVQEFWDVWIFKLCVLGHMWCDWGSWDILYGGSFQGNYNLDGRKYTNRILQEETVTEMLSQNFSHDSRFPGMALGSFDTSLSHNLFVFKMGGEERLVYFLCSTCPDKLNSSILLVWWLNL